MFAKQTTHGYVVALAGITRRTLVHGEHTLMTEFQLRKGSDLPRHAHTYEQTGYLIAGRLRVHIGSETFDAAPGDSWCIPGGVEHGADVLEDSVAIEVFSPARPDYLPGAA